jgi:hypothetical protein
MSTKFSDSGTDYGLLLDLEHGELGGDPTKAKTLLDVFRSRPSLMSWMLWTGCIWRSGTDCYSRLYQCCFVVARLCLVYGMIGFAVLASNAVAAAEAVTFVAISILFLSAVPAQILNQYRLSSHDTVITAEGSVVDRCVAIVSYFVGASVFTIAYMLMAEILLLNGQPPSDWPFPIILVVTRLYIVAYMAFNLLILLIDAHVAALAVDQLAARVQDHTIDMGALAAVREDVRSRSERWKWVNTIVIVPCLAAIVGIVLVMFFLESTHTSAQWVVFWTAIIMSFMREVMYLGIAFWFVATVNGKADTLTVALSRHVWCSGSNCVPDVGRLSVYASSLSEPIAFKLLLRRISWADVTVNVISVSVALLVGLVKYLAGV